MSGLTRAEAVIQRYSCGVIEWRFSIKEQVITEKRETFVLKPLLFLELFGLLGQSMVTVKAN